MSLHKSTSYTLDHAASACPAYLIKFPQTVWEQIQAAVRSGEDISLSHEDIMVRNATRAQALMTRPSISAGHQFR